MKSALIAAVRDRGGMRSRSCAPNQESRAYNGCLLARGRISNMWTFIGLPGWIRMSRSKRPLAQSRISSKQVTFALSVSQK